MCSEKFEKITGGIQNIVFSVGLVAAGIWAVYEFYSEEVESLDLSLSVKQVESTDEHEYILIVSLHVQNDGNQTINLPLGRNSVVASKVSFNDQGNLIRADEYTATGNYSFKKVGVIQLTRSITIDPKENRDLLFVIKLGSPGLYYVELNSLNDEAGAYWIAETIINVLPNKSINYAP